MNKNKRKEQWKIMPEPRVFIYGRIEGFLEDISIHGAGLVLNFENPEGTGNGQPGEETAGQDH